jgi:cytochrome c oxidase cbb3-type subunit 3
VKGRPVIRSLYILPAVVASLLICAATICGQDRERSIRSGEASGDSPAAKEAFAASCAGCHGLDGKGGERAPDIVTRPNIRQKSDSELLQILQKGVPRTAMPSFSYLGEPVLHLLVARLRALQGEPAAAPLPGNARQGKQLFFGRAECSNCHMVRGEGGFFASDLTTYSRGRSPEVIHDAIVFPNRNLDPHNRTVVVTLSDGKTIEGIARNEDNFSIQMLRKDGAFFLLNKSELKSLLYREESPMPADYGTRLSAVEVENLVNFLNSLTNENLKKNGNAEEEDDE